MLALGSISAPDFLWPSHYALDFSSSISCTVPLQRVHDTSVMQEELMATPLTWLHLQKYYLHIWPQSQLLPVSFGPCPSTVLCIVLPLLAVKERIDIFPPQRHNLFIAFLITVTNHLPRSNLREEGFISTYSGRSYGPSWWGKTWQKKCCAHSQEAENRWKMGPGWKSQSPVLGVLLPQEGSLSQGPSVCIDG